jgi:hypothetical protein
MSKIHVINVYTTDRSGMDNYYYIGKSKNGNALANPFSYDPNHKSKKKMTFKTREECIEAYRKYFKVFYNRTGQEELTRRFNEIYSHYANGEDVYLADIEEPAHSHGIVLAEELQKKLIRENIAKKRLEAESSKERVIF